jgi:two-component system, LytTR family, sensor kinase
VLPGPEYDYNVVTMALTKKRAVTWGLILGAWTLIVLTFSIQAYVFAVSRNRPDSFRHEFLVASTEWYVWAALTPLVLFLCRRFRITSQNWIAPVALHLAAGVVVSLLQLAVQVRLNFIVNPGYTMGYWKVLYFFATYKLHMNLLTYWVIVALNHGIFYYEQARSRELAWARMETDLANAQLQALNMQLHPHFLFNTLHSISTLISEEPAAAQEMVLKLSDLLRATLSKIETPEVALRQELELLDCYLSIEQTRFKDRLHFVKEIDPAALPCAVPTMILQPLVENAVRHGIGKHKQADEITIVGRRENGLLLLEVINRAGRMENGAETQRGIGLSNTRARLEQLYSDVHSFAIVNREGGGVAVRLSFPASDNASAAAASKA